MVWAQREGRVFCCLAVCIWANSGAEEGKKFGRLVASSPATQRARACGKKYASAAHVFGRGAKLSQGNTEVMKSFIESIMQKILNGDTFKAA